MYYAIITVSALLFSTQFLCNKKYQELEGAGWAVALRSSLYTGAFGCLVALISGGFRIDFSWYTLLWSALSVLISIISGYSSIRALQTASLSLFTLFNMLGGMLLPFFFGVLFCGEPLTWGKVACCVLVVFSLLSSSAKEPEQKGAVKYCILIFVLNGLYGVFSKAHQMNETLATDSNSFIFWQRLLLVVVCVILLLTGRHSFRIRWRAMAAVGGVAALNTVGNLLLLAALLHLPASTQYPFLTGGTIVFAAVIDLFCGGRLTVRTVASVTLAVAGAVCAML